MSKRRECELSQSNLLFFLKEAFMKGAEINFFLRRFILFSSSLKSLRRWEYLLVVEGSGAEEIK